MNDEQRRRIYRWLTVLSTAGTCLMVRRSAVGGTTRG